MANQEQLELLKQGVPVWNDWRMQNPDISPDLSAADLRSSHLRKAARSWVILCETSRCRRSSSGSRPRRAKRGGARWLTGVSLTEISLTRIDLSGANLSGANLTRTVVGETNLK